MSSEPRNISITRQGQQFGPYPEDVARQFLAEGKLKASDLAWHPGADGWKPLSEVVSAPQSESSPPPPPTPAAAPPEASPQAEPPPDTKVHITRKGEKHGPYKYATAKEYLAGGQLLSTDSAWHDGMDEWIPLGEMMGGGGKTCPQCNNALAAEAVFCIQCGYNLQTGQGTQSLPAGGAPQVAGPATYNPRDEESQKTNQLLALGIMAIVGAVLPHIAFSPFKIYFQNFDLGGKNAEWFIMMLGPLIVGITIAAMAKTAKDPVRCSVGLGLSVVLIIILFSYSGGGSGGGASTIINIGGQTIIVPTSGRGAILSLSSPSGVLYGQRIVFFLGLTALLMGCYSRHYRPGNLPAYIIALVGGGFLVLSCLVPNKGSSVPLVDAFKAFKNVSVLYGIALVIGIGTKIAASVFCFVTTRAKSAHEVANKSDLSIKLLIGGIILAHGLMMVGGFINIFKGGGDFGPKLSFCISNVISLVKNLAGDGGLYLVPALAGSFLLIGNAMRKP